jgi:para-aminobenzoate synthetase / 4-amino-4-deoxychorismate lyase
MDTVAEVCEILSGGEFAILDNNKPGSSNRVYLFSRPIKYCVAHTPEDVEAQLSDVDECVHTRSSRLSRSRLLLV